jgi:hypothetical protein
MLEYAGGLMSRTGEPAAVGVQRQTCAPFTILPNLEFLHGTEYEFDEFESTGGDHMGGASLPECTLK